MNLQQLDHMFRHINESETYHINHPNELSKKYDKIPTIIIDNEQVYSFSYSSVLHKNKIGIMKNSRFTMIPIHVHEIIEMSYMYSGECMQNFNNKKIYMKTGDVCILDTNVPHSVENLREDDILINIVMKKAYFSSSFLSRLSSQGLVSNFITHAISQNQKYNRYIYFDTGNSTPLREAMCNLFCEFFDQKICSSEIIDSYMVIIFSHLLRLYKERSVSDVRAQEKNSLIEILKYIETNYKDCSLQSCAKRFNFHPNYLSHLLKSQTGKSFKSLIIIQKMTRASFLLQNSNIPIYEIAKEIGYENLGFFYKKFHDIFNVTPQEYRDTYLNYET